MSGLRCYDTGTRPDLPRLERLQLLHVLDSLGDVPNLVGVDHENTPGRSSVLALNRLGVDVLPVVPDVLRVVDDRSDQHSSTEIVLPVGTDF